jgi:hypothetical protein
VGPESTWRKQQPLAERWRLISLTLSEPGVLRIAAGTAMVDEMIANGERLFREGGAIPNETFLRLFRFGAGSSHATPGELPDELVRGVELLKRERPSWRRKSRSSG